LEVYGDGALLRWLFLPRRSVDQPDPAEWFLDPLAKALLEDDLGNVYRGDTQSSGANPGVMRGETSFVPAPPEQASHLVVRVAGGQFEVPLR
jgi:hypothetical protein